MTRRPGLSRGLSIAPPSRPITRAVTEAGVGGFNPRSLFGGGEQGLIYDLSNRASLYVDSARTTPVTTAGDLIGSVSDLSGNNNHASQATDASKPGWQTTYATFDGSNDWWQTAAINLTGTDAVTVIASFRKLSDAARGMLLETGSGALGSFAIQAPSAAAGNNVVFTPIGTTGTNAIATGLASPISVVATGFADISSDTNTLRINGSVAASSSGDLGTGNFANLILYIGRRGGSTLPFNGRLYRLLIIGRQLTAAEIANAEAWAGDPL